MKKGLILVAVLFLGVLFISQISALQVSFNQDSNVIIKDLDTEIVVTMMVTNAPKGIYNVYTLADISLRPIDIFTIDTGSMTKEFIMKPNENLKIDGPYTFTYTLNHRDVQKVNNRVTIKLLNLKDVIEIYSDNVNYETGEVVFYVKNKENVSIKNLSARFSSVLFDTRRNFDLKPYDEYKIALKVDKDVLKTTKAGAYVIESTFDTKEGAKKIDGKLYLGEKKGVVSSENKSGFFVQTHVINKVNSGNVLETVRVDMEKNVFSRLFTSFNIEPNMVEREGFVIKYSWIENRLEPSGSLNVRARTNYLLPILVIVVAILAFFGLKRFVEAKVEVFKSVHPVRTKNGEFALKVTLSVKTRRGVGNVTLVDKIPRMLKIYNRFGTIKPHRIDVHNRRLHWNIGNLDAGEERVFSYIVYSKVGVLGKFSLPEAVAIFENDGKIQEVESNQVFFMSEQTRRDNQ
jgi:hypothetical protein